MKIGFDNEKYLKIQSEQIKKRIAQFGDKLYLEFGGKLFDDHHASRVLPGFQPDSKLQMLLKMSDQAEIVMVVVSIVLNRIFYPTPYQFGRMAEYIVLALAIFFVAEWVEMPNEALQYTLSTAFIVLYLCYAVWREKIDIKALTKAIIGKFIR